MTDEIGNSTNTAVVHFRLIRTITRRAIKEGVMNPAHDPFIRFTVPVETPTNRSKLSADNIAALEALALTRGSALDQARDLFLFALYAAGIRFGDVVMLQWKNIQHSEAGMRLLYRMSKTQAEKDLKLNPKAAAILDKYRPKAAPKHSDLVFPHLKSYDLSSRLRVVSATGSKNVVVNRLLKELASMAGITVHLSFHASRHSFADLARRNGADVYKVSKALGHSDLKVTTRYLAGFDSGAADEAIDIAFS